MFEQHVGYDIDRDHEKIGDKPQFNYFINIAKNLGAHLFINCEAQSLGLYPYRSLLEEEQFTTCFSDYHDLMVSARVGKNGCAR